jgi:hypothetical protein
MRLDQAPYGTLPAIFFQFKCLVSGESASKTEIVDLLFMAPIGVAEVN